MNSVLAGRSCGERGALSLQILWTAKGAPQQAGLGPRLSAWGWQTGGHQEDHASDFLKPG